MQRSKSNTMVKRNFIKKSITVADRISKGWRSSKLNSGKKSVDSITHIVYLTLPRLATRLTASNQGITL